MVNGKTAPILKPQNVQVCNFLMPPKGHTVLPQIKKLRKDRQGQCCHICELGIPVPGTIPVRAIWYWSPTLLCISLLLPLYCVLYL